MKTYRVRMNEIESQDGNRKPFGRYFRHISSHSLSAAKRDAERLFYGSCESVSQKDLTSKDLLVQDMIDGQSYEILADTDFTNDTVIFKKEGNVIFSTIRGGDFSEEGYTKWFDLSIVELLDDVDIVYSPTLTIEELEWIDLEVYNQVSMFFETPTKFIGLFGNVTAIN